ncbi:hypothetical protein OBBRIDRAFT_824525 [Obba rivulosa]|uniref:Uncharacterized protein n=1 Tax=Obba rivulosa TaxID=1052685 RepID=A0A8E2B550_9APHY|nr:hypothetical protein OBBRIDRAFT_824525 [Obba rivulosa]
MEDGSGLSKQEQEQIRRESLSTYFQKSATVVRESAKRFEHEYARPGMNMLLTAYERHPVRSSFLGVLFALSILPTLAFIGFSLFVFTTCIFIALTGAIIVSAAVVLACSVPFVAILVVLLCFSLFMTGSGIGAYLFFRLLVLVRNDGARAGIAGWTRETKTRIRSPASQPQQQVKEDTNEEHALDEDAASDGSDTFTAVSAVVFDQPVKSEPSEGSGEELGIPDLSLKEVQ